VAYASILAKYLVNARERHACLQTAFSPFPHLRIDILGRQDESTPQTRVFFCQSLLFLSRHDAILVPLLRTVRATIVRHVSEPILTSSSCPPPPSRRQLAVACLPFLTSPASRCTRLLICEAAGDLNHSKMQVWSEYQNR
jgi:hypothetical protein